MSKTPYRASIQKFRNKITYGFSTLVLLFSTVSGTLPLLLTQTAAAAGSTAYSTMPSAANYPGSYPSQGYEATQTSELGDYVQLTGTNRKLSSVRVSLTSWACENDFTKSGQTWTANRAGTDACVTTPGSHYKHDVTLNIYNVDNSGGTPAVGGLIRSKTVNATIPFRPSYDPANTHNCKTPANDVPFGGTWYDSQTDSCVHGKAFDVTFSGLTAANNILPNDIIVAVAYNTSHYGAHPIGAVGPYDSLNLSLTTTTPYSGTNVESDAVFLRTSGALNRDTGWGGYTPVMKINTVAVPTVQPCTTTANVETTDMSTWNTSETRATGHNDLTPTGLRVWTEGATSTDKAAAYYSTDFPLSGLGDQTIAQSFDYTTTSGTIAPGLQLMTDFDNNGTVDGILVGESTYGNNWWLSSGASQFVKDNAPHTGGGYGSSWYGTPNDWLAQFPDAKVKAIGYSLGSGVKGDYTIKRITLGCTNYTFKLVPTAAPTNLKFNYKDASEVDHTLACGQGINSTKANQFHMGGSLNLNWTAPAGSVTGYQVLVTYPDGSTHLNYQGPNPWAWIQFNGGEGQYTYQVRSSNAAGTSDYSDSCSLYYDTHSPEASFTTAPANNSQINGNFHVSGVATDNVALKSVNFDVRDNTGWKAGCTSALVANYSADHKSATVSCDINTANLTEGASYYVRIHASDYAGYGSHDVAPASIRNFTIDRTAPVAPTSLSWKTASNKTVQDNGYTNEYSGAAQWQAVSDADHYIYKYWNDITGNPYKVGSEYTTTTTATNMPGVFNQGEGVHHFCVIAVDAAGNQSTCTEFTLTYDKTRPTVTLTNPTNFTTPYQHGFVATATATDNLSGLQTFVIHVYKSSNASAAKFCTATATELANGSMSCDLSGLADGSYYIKTGAIDRAGNNQTVTSADFVIDSVAPTITVKPGYVGDLSGKVFSNVSFKLYDAHKVDKYVINGFTVDFTNNTYSDANFQNIKSHLVEGSNTLTLYDVAGNATTYTFTYDNTAPVLTIDSQTKNSDGTYAISGTTTDPASDVIVTLDGTTLTGVTVSGNTWTVNTGLLVASTTYTVTANSTDAAGNAAVEQTTDFTTEAAPAIVGGRGSDTPQGGTPQTLQSTTPRGQVLASNTTAGDTNDDGAVLGAEGNSGTSSSSDKNSNDKTIKNAKETTCAKFLGICWYYWIPVVLIVGYIVYRFFKAADENETTSGR